MATKSKIVASPATWIIRFGMLVSGMALFILGMPRLMGELLLLPGTTIYEQIFIGGNNSDNDLAVLEHSSQMALEYAEIPKAYRQLGTSYLLQANREQLIESKEQLAAQSVDALTNGLALAPLSTFAWSQLSSAKIIMGEAQYDDAIDAWKTSIAVARFEPFLLVQRIHIGIVLYAQMKEEERLLLNKQVHLAYDWDRQSLREYARQYQLIEWVLFLGPNTVESRRFLYEKAE